MLSLNKWTLALGLAMAATTLFGASGCVVVTDCDYEVCDTYCDVYCDPWGCWEECWDDCYCVDYADEFVAVPDGPVDECQRHSDCAQGSACDDGVCVDIIDDNNDVPVVVEPGAGLCQACESSDDCQEEGALCIQLNEVERVCARACDSDVQCPRGFECAVVSQEADAERQCIPVLDEADQRSCSDVSVEPEPTCVSDESCGYGYACVNGECIEAEPDPDPEPTPACALNDDCAEGQVCIDGVCAEADPEPLSCETSADCPEGQACMTGACVEVECFASADCLEGEVCVNAQCEVSCANNGDCPEGTSCNSLNYCE